MFRFIPFSLVDSPAGSAAVVFCRGCSLSCKYCYNLELRSFTPNNDLTLEQIKEKILELKLNTFTTVDWLIISGGEPLFKDITELVQLCNVAKSINLKVGIYTTGIFPEKIKILLDNNLINYYHVDYKYKVMVSNSDIDQFTLSSIQYIKNRDIKMHINTTLLKSIHTKEVLQQMHQNINLPIIINKGQHIQPNKCWIWTPVSTKITDTLVPLTYNDYYSDSELQLLYESINN